MDLIKYIFEKPALTRKIARWQMLLLEYDIVYVTQKVIKGSALADFLAHQPVEDYQPMLSDFPDEDISALFHTDEYNHDVNTWTLFFDGSWHRSGAHLSRESVYTYDNKTVFRLY